VSKKYDESRYMNLFQMIDKETGEITRESRWSGSMLGDDYFVMYKQAMDKLLHDSAAPETALRVFIKLCTMQTFEHAVVVSRTFLMNDLKTTRKTLWKCLTYLKEHAYIMETTINGHSAFIINPDVSNCGKASIPTKQRAFAQNPFGNKPGLNVLRSVDYSALDDDSKLEKKEKGDGVSFMFDAHS